MTDDLIYSGQPLAPREERIVTDPTATFDITPNITVDQADRIAKALEARQRVEEDCRQLLQDMMTRLTSTMSGNCIVPAGDIAEARELLADWKVKNRAFEAAVFERKPGALPDTVPAVTGEFPT